VAAGERTEVKNSPPLRSRKRKFILLLDGTA
jgi:hypothetical protein